MRFSNRAEAAALLARRLCAYDGQHPLVLGVPRGAGPMAAAIADALHGELDVILVRKLRAPGNPELAIGAVDEAGTVVRGRYIDLASDEYLRDEIAAQLATLRARRARYTKARPAIDPAGRTVIIVDDGIATGASMRAAIRAVRARRPRKIVVAVAVASADALASFRREVDDVVCLCTPAEFYAVGQVFDDFSEVTDDMVVAALGGQRRAEPATGVGRER
jgi:predicted phosphoribosyltransferase